MYYIENKEPQLVELLQYVASNFDVARKWRDLGLRLNLHQVELDDIQNDSYNRTSPEYCRSVLQNWLRMSPNPSWDQLISAINELYPVSEITYTGRNLIAS